MALLQNKDVSIAEIEKILRYDPGLTANVLKLANSSYFGIPSKVGSLKHAIALLGVKRFSQLVLTACMSNNIDKAVEGYDLPPGDLWRHSIAVSKTAEALAKFVKLTDAGDVFTPALLHDMGKVLLDKFINEGAQAIKDVVAGGVPWVVAENMILGTDHAEIGAQILAHWSFPSDIVNAVRLHHNPERVKQSNGQTEIVYLSNMLCNSHGDGNSIKGHDLTPSPVVLRRLNISFSQYGTILDRVCSWINELSGTLDFD
jgi:putative nucleotidyltransferase with HDIG domain